MALVGFGRCAVIGVRSPMREPFAACSSGGSAGWYATKGDAIAAFNAALLPFGFCLDYGDTMYLPGKDGRAMVAVVRDGESDPAGWALLTWYEMPSGRWEFVGYLT